MPHVVMYACTSSASTAYLSLSLFCISIFYLCSRPAQARLEVRRLAETGLAPEAAVTQSVETSTSQGSRKAPYRRDSPFLLLLAAVSNNARVSIRNRTPSLSFFLVVIFTYLSSFSYSLSPFRPEDVALLETVLTADGFHVWECVRTILPLEVGVWVPFSRVRVHRTARPDHGYSMGREGEGGGVSLPRTYGVVRSPRQTMP